MVVSTVVPSSFVGVDSFDKTRSSFRWTPSTPTKFQQIIIARLHLELNKGGRQDRELTVCIARLHLGPRTDCVRL